jgi:formate C-acetyltransferase
MIERIACLRDESCAVSIQIDPERAQLVTEFYKHNEGKYSVPVLRALCFKELCEKKTLYFGKGELIVGERGSAPGRVPTFPEIVCHTLDGLEQLNHHKNIPYQVSEKCISVYKDDIIPYWQGRSMRDRIMQLLDEEWKQLYSAGIFTEFMEQRAPGVVSFDGTFYTKGLLDCKQEITENIARLDFFSDRDALGKHEQLTAMSIVCDGLILFAKRYAELAERLASEESDLDRVKELTKIASNCRQVPAGAPTDFWEALQMYWFLHLGVIMELNGWDACSPGYLDRWLYPFYKNGYESGTFTKEFEKELLEAFWIKFNNNPAPPKMGTTAYESGTYNDFVNINLAGVLEDGADAVNELSYLMLEVLDELHIIQPQACLVIGSVTPDRFVRAGFEVIKKGYGYPSLFNADGIILQQLRTGKSLKDARGGGVTGCVETCCLGKEAPISTGYLNGPKMLEITLNSGIDPMTGRKIGLETGDPRSFKTFDQLLDALERQIHYFIDVKISRNQLIEQMYARYMPAVFSSVIVDDCIMKGMDYHAGGPRYNGTYLQFVGLGTLTDSLSSLKKHVFDEKNYKIDQVLNALVGNYVMNEEMRLTFVNRTPRYGNDDEYADALMQRISTYFIDAIDGRINTKGDKYRIVMLPTTCHIYFGSVTGATPDGRFARSTLSEGISPVQGADHEGPTAVLKSCKKIDQLRTCGTLLNMKFAPTTFDEDECVDKLVKLVRTYFRYGGHHIQFNVVDTETLRAAQKDPGQYRNLIVRVAGYSDYFCGLGSDLQNEIISRTMHMD